MDYISLNEPTQSKITREEAKTLSEQRARELEKSLEETVLPPGYFIKDDWLIFQSNAKKEGDEPPPPIRICSRLDIIARTRDIHGDNHGRLLRFKDPDGVVHEWAMPMELLGGDAAIVRQQLLKQGLLIDSNQDARKRLIPFIEQSLPQKTLRCVQQTGWSNDFKLFVLPDLTLGESGGESLIFQGITSNSSSKACSGTLAGCQELSKLCRGNTRLLLALSCAFAAPILRVLGIENGGFHFKGTSSCGKTTCLHAAGSVWGGQDYVKQWRATSNGLEGVATSCNDGLICLDEIAQADPSEIGTMVYMIANGGGKSRADKMGGLQQVTAWRSLLLSSGEVSLLVHMQTAKKKPRAGLEVRFLDISADTSVHGCFENLHGFYDGKAFADHLKDLCGREHGHLGREFLRRFIRNRSSMEMKARVFIGQFASEYTPIGASEQVCRAVTRFALVAAVGEIATELGVTCWEPGEAANAAVICLESWLKRRGGIGIQEEQQVLSAVRMFFELHGEGRFSLLASERLNEGEDAQPRTLNRAGFRQRSSEGGDFMVLPGVFKEEICNGFELDFVLTVLNRHGLLKTDAQGKSTRAERLPGKTGTTRVYRISGKILGGDDEGELKSKISCETSETKEGNVLLFTGNERNASLVSLDPSLGETESLLRVSLSHLSHQENDRAINECS
jgi:putative DNA primase/helicase